MTPAVTVELIAATVELEQPIAGGMRTVGTGFLISDPTPDGRPRVVLVTANHVFDRMKGDDATVGYRIEQSDGSWSYAPQQISIRASDGKALWVRHPTRDVAAISITAPPAFAQAAIPIAWLAGDDALGHTNLAPGDELMTLGYPQGLSANTAGFPILRAGRVASYPLGPSKAFPTFLLDFRVFPGNSGGPVYLDTANAPAPGAAVAEPVIAGMLTQQVEVGQENLGIGIVTQAQFIRETLAELDQPASAPAGATDLMVPGASTPASALTRAESAPRNAVAAQVYANSP
ncbi:MAG TPA: serine protease [Caulobacteraceae bacterium]|jgi:S1-C subfamily serine protease